MLTKAKADKFFNENREDFEAMCNLFIAVAHSGDLELLTYLCTCVERVTNCTLQAMKQGQVPENPLSWN